MSPAVAALVRKEVRETLRSAWLYVATTVVYATFLQWFVVRNYRSLMEADPRTLGLATATSLVYVFPLVIPFFANVLLTRSLAEERVRQSLLPMLATGVSPGLVWVTKLLTAFGLGYVVALVCFVLDLLMVRSYFGIEVALTAPLALATLVVYPLATLGILAVMAFLFWTVRQANVVASVLPVLVTMGLWYYAGSHPATRLGWLLPLVAAGAAAALVVLCALAIGRMPRRHIAGL